MQTNKALCAAHDLLRSVSRLLEWVGEHEPDRLERPGWINVANDHKALDEALVAYFSDPSANVVGKVQSNHPNTSKKAALEVAPRSGTQRRAVLDAITNSADGMTDEEVQLALEMKGNTQCPRRLELVEGGWIEDSGVTRMTSNGKDAIVWVATNRRKESQ